jgi:polyhydroxyalkanoate synthesis repressor PhaR
MAESAAPSAAPSAAGGQVPVVVKKYANRRLYNTETSSYITLENLAEMIRGGRDFVVYDAKTGDDITRGVLTQIIVEEESKGSALLPTTFLRQLIGFYGDSLQGVVPRYLEQAMTSFARQQQQLRQAMQHAFNPFLPFDMEEMGRQNMAMIERAISLFNPFAPRGSADNAQHLAPQADAETAEEVERLRHEIAGLHAELAAARAHAARAQAALDAAMPAAESPVAAPAAAASPRAPRSPRKNAAQ